YRASDLLLVASEVATDGDRDGLPNVVVEALSQGLPVVATRAGAIPELVIDGVHGRLVTPAQGGAPPEAIRQLMGAGTARWRRGGEGARGGWVVGGGGGCEHPPTPRCRHARRRGGGRRRHRRAGCSLVTPLAFYTPVKHPFQTEPSGDRELGRLLMAALRAIG